MNRLLRETWEKSCQNNRSDGDTAQEELSMLVVKVVAFLQSDVVGRLRVQQTVGGIERPDRRRHCQKRSWWKPDATSSRDEPCPENGDCGCVKRKKVPERRK